MTNTLYQVTVPNNTSHEETKGKYLNSGPITHPPHCLLEILVQNNKAVQKMIIEIQLKIILRLPELN